MVEAETAVLLFPIWSRAIEHPPRWFADHRLRQPRETTRSAVCPSALIDSTTRVSQASWVREAAGERANGIELSHVAHRASVTDQRDAVIAELAPTLELTSEQLSVSPDFQIGSVDQIGERIQEQRERFGISHIEVNAAEATNFAPVVARLDGQ